LLTKPIKPAQLYESLVRVVSGPKPWSEKSRPSKRSFLAARLPLRTLVCDDNVINRKSRYACSSKWVTNRARRQWRGALAVLDQQAYDLIFMTL